METYEALEKALALIEDERRWCQEDYKTKDRHCSLGALGAVGIPEGNGVESAAVGVLERHCGEPLSFFNDSHSHAEVVALFQEAIRAEKRKSGTRLDSPRRVASGELDASRPL